MANYWLSWFAKDCAYELHSPWWISGEDADGNPSICAAIKAESQDAAWEKIKQAHDSPPDSLAERFIKEMPNDWLPFNDRFIRADWMMWP